MVISISSAILYEGRKETEKCIFTFAVLWSEKETIYDSIVLRI